MPPPPPPPPPVVKAGAGEVPVATAHPVRGNVAAPEPGFVYRGEPPVTPLVDTVSYSSHSFAPVKYIPPLPDVASR